MEAPEITTDIENGGAIDGQNARRAVKFVKDEKVFLLLDGKVYDVTGKIVIP